MEHGFELFLVAAIGTLVALYVYDMVSARVTSLPQTGV